MTDKNPSQTLVHLSYDDFRREADGTWVTTRQINVAGPKGEQTLIAEGRRFKSRQLFMFGRDLADILDLYCAGEQPNG